MRRPRSTAANLLGPKQRSHTLKRRQAPISSSVRRNVRIWLRERKSRNIHSAPARMRVVVWLSPRAWAGVTTALPDGAPIHQRVLLVSHHDHWLIAPLRGFSKLAESALQRIGVPARPSQARNQCRRARLRWSLKARLHLQVLAVYNGNPPSSVIRCEASTSASALRISIRAPTQQSILPRPRIAGHVLSQFQHHAGRSSRNADVFGENHRSIDRFITES